MTRNHVLAEHMIHVMLDAKTSEDADDCTERMVPMDGQGHGTFRFEGSVPSPTVHPLDAVICWPC